jgi:cell division cycle 20-like protein 1 (cofactor of APC complex)
VQVTKLCDLGVDDNVCSVGWAQRGTHLAVGTNQGKVQVWDATRCKRIRTMESHRMRVGALAWNSSLLSSGSRDKSILHHDIRAQDDYISRLAGHKSEVIYFIHHYEFSDMSDSWIILLCSLLIYSYNMHILFPNTFQVCGLKWSYDNRQLASGGNDNRLYVWNQHSAHPVLKYTEHTAAVKAIAWSPHLHGLLASGGGTADRCIRFWNTTTNMHLNCVDTGSQVFCYTSNFFSDCAAHVYSSEL